MKNLTQHAITVRAPDGTDHTFPPSGTVARVATVEMSYGVLTRALASMAKAGLSLADSLDPSRQDDFLRAPGIERKALARLQEHARETGPHQPAMPSHNRANPAAKEIAAARAESGLTQEQAGAVVGVARRTWQDWEAGRRRMPAGLFELFLIKTNLNNEEKK